MIVTEVVRNAFSYNRMGYASAMSWVLFVADLRHHVRPASLAETLGVL